MYTYRCISCNCHWHTVYFTQLLLTLFKIPRVHISYNSPLTHSLSAFHTLVYWNIPCVHFIVVIEKYSYSIACQAGNGWFNKLTKRHSYESPPPKLDPLKTMKNEEINNYHHAQIHKYIPLNIWKRLDTRYTYTCIYSK